MAECFIPTLCNKIMNPSATKTVEKTLFISFPEKYPMPATAVSTLQSQSLTQSNVHKLDTATKEMHGQLCLESSALRDLDQA